MIFYKVHFGEPGKIKEVDTDNLVSWRRNKLLITQGNYFQIKNSHYFKHRKDAANFIEKYLKEKIEETQTSLTKWKEILSKFEREEK